MQIINSYTFDEVVGSVTKALQKLKVDDGQLLIENANERAIAHQLAIKLSEEFTGYNVDCEYNRLSSGGIKKIHPIVGRLKEIRGNVYSLKNFDDKGIADLSLSPDIIVHQPDSARNNLLIIEVKKSANNNPEAYAFYLLKIEHYTRLTIKKINITSLYYRFGLFLELCCKQQSGNHKLIWCEDGKRKPEMTQLF